MSAIDPAVLREMVRADSEALAERGRRVDLIRRGVAARGLADGSGYELTLDDARLLVAELDDLRRYEAALLDALDRCGPYDPLEDEGPGPVARALLGWVAFAGLAGLSVAAVGAARLLIGRWRRG